MESTPNPGSLASIFNAHHPYPAPKLSSPVLLESNSNSDQMINCIVEFSPFVVKTGSFFLFQFILVDAYDVKI